MNDKLKEFCEAHAVRILDTNKRAHRFYKFNLKFFRDPFDYNNVLKDEVNVETEPLYTVEIAESELIKIAEFESQVFNNMKQTGHYNMFEILMEQKQREKYLRQKYAAVNKAYEHYSNMLKLAESGEL